jgi:hypothetical protein
MHTEDTKKKFTELRAQGWSLARIAARLDVAKSTLVFWQRELQWDINTLRAIHREELQEKVLASLKKDLAQISAQRKALEKELARRKLDDVSTDKLFHLAALLRQQLQKVQERLESAEPKSQIIPLPIHPLVSTLAEMGEFEANYGFSMVPSKNCVADSAKPVAEPDKSAPKS